MTLTTSHAAALLEPRPNTPQKWLIYVHELKFPNPKIQDTTQRKLGDLSLLEAHALFSLLDLHDAGKRTVVTRDITKQGNRSIPQKIIIRLIEKKFVSQIDMMGKRNQFRLRLEAIPLVRATKTALSVFIDKTLARL